MKVNNKNYIHPWQKKPTISKTRHLDIEPTWTLVMPVFNQEENLHTVLDKIYKMACYPFEIILIDDCSSDLTLKKMKEFCSNLSKYNKKIVASTIIHNKLPIFETACDNQGFRLAKAEFIIEVQADIHIEEQDFDRKMIFAMKELNLSSVSGRQVHHFSLLTKKNRWLKYPLQIIKWNFLKTELESFGKVGNKIFKRESMEKNVCFIGETVSRGPWLVTKKDLKKNNYLDDKNFFLGNDDHDFNRRMFKKYGRLAGFVPMDIYSIAEHGSARRRRFGINNKIYKYLKTNKKGSEEFNDFLLKYRPYSPIIKKLIK